MALNDFKLGKELHVERIGITERGDAALDTDWLSWVIKDNPAILITKNPIKLCQILERYRFFQKRIMIHCTITGYGATPVEPNVPTWKEALTLGYLKLIKKMGLSRIILRVDPIILNTDGITLAEDVINMARDIYPNARIRISFLDNYAHVQKRFTEIGLEVPSKSFHFDITTRKSIVKRLSPVEICGEPGIPSMGCISKLDCDILRVKPAGQSKQRSSCSCLGNKLELLKYKNPCFHGCLYCYWRVKCKN